MEAFSRDCLRRYLHVVVAHLPHLRGNVLGHDPEVHADVEGAKAAQVDGQNLLEDPEVGTQHPPDGALEDVEEPAAEAQREKPHVDHEHVVPLVELVHLAEPLHLSLKQHGREAEDDLVERHQVGERSPDSREGVQYLQDRQDKGRAPADEGQDLHALRALLDAMDRVLAHVARGVHCHASHVLGARLHLRVLRPRLHDAARLVGEVRRPLLDGLEHGVLHCRICKRPHPGAADGLLDLGVS
mmetsp:Transcript_39550/g.107014  ORF Transcript_39550/g.107014 Transcript_39550/m.107014 type:complete len:242 (-) Transcript_39550:217-942(-)